MLTLLKTSALSAVALAAASFFAAPQRVEAQTYKSIAPFSCVYPVDGPHPFPVKESAPNS